MVSKKDKVQDLNIKQVKLEVQVTYKRDEKKTTKFKAVNDEDIINKSYLDEQLLNTNGHLSFLDKRLQRIYITIQRSKCRRNFNSTSCENGYTKFL